ncbi:hypothetical protein ACH4OV_25300 [Streptomyces diastaticus]|uniref:hypothetical protein n=1 Tax=Streptomyces diastaticus TaxID=1956 RepID=UPI00378DD04A
MANLSKVRVFLSSGQTFDIEAESVKTRRNAENELVEMSWTDPTSGRPLYLKLAAVDAVVEL